MADNAENTFDAIVRTSFGKGASRQLRREGQTPAVIYGHGAEPVHVALEAHQLGLALRTSNALLTVKTGDDEHLVLVKDVQRDPVKRIIEHVDLLAVKRGEKVEVEVPLHLVGEPVGGTIAETDLNTILLSVEAIAIPENVKIEIEGAEEGTKIFAKDLVLPEGAELVTDLEALVLSVIIPSAADMGDSADELAVEAAEAEAAAEAEGAGDAETTEA
ncbi:50S ribosomal protein L25/general stress protein Ctc [Pseudoclavibacter sp. CFCC 13796]|uniref:50S ribosomal protein L25/general stress protein Ctc n=1 Tax=Pseudoclavibacter sp. CFCC 13796 TaxID=2615179 RepID=UPI0013014A63|nr:50S ribosomal protein L25/general stress protein Ctc [Pseudoclavibacter sp. CFCC 13796]KAB1659982.1 50S ribosomal protein L25/general stress protein Ctc [Pseudoclavibacter sp. CFCC 13796]